MAPKRSTQTAPVSVKDASEEGGSALFRGGSPSPDTMQVETDLGLGSGGGGNSRVSTSAATNDVDMEEAAAPSGSQAEPMIAEQSIEMPTGGGDAELPQTAVTAEEDGTDAPTMDKGKSISTRGRDRPTIESTATGELLASLPVYYSTALPPMSALQVFQYPTYPRGRPLPMPQIARERGVRPSMRVRPRAKRVEVELPLDLRTPVYNADKGEEYGEGAAAAGGPIGSGGPTIKQEKKVKSEFGLAGSSASERARSSTSSAKPRLERTRLESNLMPHQTQYMLGVIRDKALHLTPVDSIHQLRPSMHYIDAIESIKRQASKANEERNKSEAEDADETRAANAAAAKSRKVQNLNVSFRADMGGGSSSSASASATARAGGKPGGMDSRDMLMLAEREAESERWVEVEWKMEDTEEARKTFDAQLFAASKTPLVCTTKPREYLESGL